MLTSLLLHNAEPWYPLESNHVDRGCAYFQGILGLYNSVHEHDRPFLDTGGHIIEYNREVVTLLF